ncbi:MAG: hypothetical protein F4Z29_01205 [Gemmatimonadetes bacterium]|nr:hypothetical protein [Gemmatimonadota bacterium]
MYASLDDYKRYRSTTDLEGVDDTLSTMFLEAATARVDELTRRRFMATADTSRSFSVMLSRQHKWVARFDDDLAQIEAVSIDGRTLTAGNYSPVPMNDWPKYGLTIHRNVQVDEMSVVEISGRWAWSTTPPADVKLATMRLAAYYEVRKDAQVFDVIGDDRTGEIRLPRDGEPLDALAICRKRRRSNMMPGPA